MNTDNTYKQISIFVYNAGETLYQGIQNLIRCIQSVVNSWYKQRHCHGMSGILSSPDQM